MAGRLKSKGAALLLGLGMAASVGSAHAEGIIALGVPADVAADGVAIGVAVRMTLDEAQKEAMSQCKLSEATDSTISLCAIAGTFTNRRVSVAYNPKDGTTGFGWAIADDKGAAEKQAMANCETADGALGLCVIGGSACDGTAIPE